MRVYSCKVRLSGSPQNEVSKINVTAAEIAVLRKIHSSGSAESEAAGIVDAESVVDIVHTGDISRTDAEERMRLQNLYGTALWSMETIKNIEGLFGVGNPLPTHVNDADGVVVPDKKPVRTKKVAKKAEKKEEAPKETGDDADDLDADFA